MRAVPLALEIRLSSAIRSHRLNANSIGLAAVATLVAVAFTRLVYGGARIGLDAGVQFYPDYIFLGASLSSGNIPLWNPYQDAGIPFAADLQSGWTYLPAMILFTLFPVGLAVAGLLLVHLALAAFGTFALGRLLGVGLGGSVMAAAAYVLSGWYWLRIGCCTVDVAVASWMPGVLVFAELGLRSTRLRPRVCWWMLSGLCLSQVLAVWLGQGAYYTSIVVGAYLLSRTVIWPSESWSFRQRWTQFALHAAVIFSLGFALDAVAILPRLEFQGLSSLSKGYEFFGERRGGWKLERTAERLMGRTSYYAGAVTLIFAVCGLVTGRRKSSTYLFGFLVAIAVVFSMARITALHRLAYALLPYFEDLQRHLPDRIMIIAFLPIALLAGIGVDRLADGSLSRRRHAVAIAATCALAGFAYWLDPRHSLISDLTIIPMVAAAGLVALWAVVPGQVRRAIIPLALLVLVADVVPAGNWIVGRGIDGLYQEHIDVDQYYDATPSAQFLLDLQASSPEPFRYFGYDPGIQGGNANQPVLYRFAFAEEITSALIVNNRAMTLGLDDVQGGNNPLHVERYVEYQTVMNGLLQNYHDTNVYAAGLDSPLLDLLNVRYIVVPTIISPDREDLKNLIARHATVYQDTRVRILENAEALPRAWIVHDAQTVTRGEALPLLANGSVDPRTTALIEAAIPELGAPPAGAQESASVSASEPNRMVIETNSATPGLLVLSEISYPAWHAYVDGERVPMFVANHALRAVPIPAGEHRVEIRYESRSFAIGLAITLTAITGCIATLIWVTWPRWGSRWRRANEFVRERKNRGKDFASRRRRGVHARNNGRALPDSKPNRLHAGRR